MILSDLSMLPLVLFGNSTDYAPAWCDVKSAVYPTPLPIMYLQRLRGNN